MDEIRTKWKNQKIPCCKIGKNHKWKGSKETGVCLKCGYDVFDGCYKELEENPSYSKEYPFYCCQCQQNTDGLSTCHDCGHMKGRWKTDKHHCIRPDWEGMQKNLQEQIVARK